MVNQHQIMRLDDRSIPIRLGGIKRDERSTLLINNALIVHFFELPEVVEGLKVAVDKVVPPIDHFLKKVE